MSEDGQIRYSADYVQDVVDDVIRDYLVKYGIPRVADFIEEGPSGAHADESHPGLLLLGYVGDPDEAFYIRCETGDVFYLNSKTSFFVNSSPQLFVASFRAYLDVTYGDLAGRDDLVEARLRAELLALDPAAIEDPDSFWNDTLGDVLIGIYGDDPD